jgi:hypothetical protein
MLPLGLQYKLLAHKISTDDIELEAPPDVSRDIVMLRKSLDVATQAFFRCVARDDTDAGSLQGKLSAYLHTDRSRRDDPNTQDGVYGANLTVHIEPAKGFTNSMFVVLTFGIECGDDNLLFLYTREDGRWIQRLHWYGDKYTEPSDAYGDFFLYGGVPGPKNEPLVAAAHGTPWCTSRMSAFHVDLLQPSSAKTAQKNLAHRDDYYSRDDDVPRTLKITADGFDIRVRGDSLDFDNLFTRPRIFRFRTTDGALERIQPVANNARDFVDVWLQERWGQSAHWADHPN